MIRATYVDKEGKCSSLRAVRTPNRWDCLFFIQGTVNDGVWLGIEEHLKERVVEHVNPYGWKFKFRIVNHENLRIPPTVYFISKEQG